MSIQKTEAVCSPLDFRTPQLWALNQVHSTRYEFPPVVQQAFLLDYLWATSLQIMTWRLIINCEIFISSVGLFPASSYNLN